MFACHAVGCVQSLTLCVAAWKHSPWGESLSLRPNLNTKVANQMDIKSLIEKRNKLMVDAKAVITKDNVTTDDRSNFDKTIADADVLSADITRM